MRSGPAAYLPLGLALVLAVFFIAPAAADQGWMFRADEAHTGRYTDCGMRSMLEIRWSTQTNGEVTSSPAVVDGVVYVGSNDGYVYALNAAEGSTRWSTRTNGEVASSPAVVDGVVYVGSRDHSIYALNAADGSIRWSTQTDGEVASSPAVVDGVVYVGSRDHYVYALDASNGTKIWSTHANGEVVSSPAVVNGVVYIGSNDGYVYALDASDGTKRWNTRIKSGEVTSSPAVVDGVVYIGSDGWFVCALNAADGEMLWSTAASGEFSSSPAVVDGVVYIGANDNYVHALDASDGTILWEYFTYGEVASSPAVVDGVVYVGSNDNYVYALDASDGKKLWSYLTNGDVTSSPAVVEGVVYIGSIDHHVYALASNYPVPAFSATPVHGPYPLTVTFTDESTETITGWHWDFGDGNTSTDQNPVHTYTLPGSYTVTLTVAGPGGTVSLVGSDYIEVTAEFPGTPAITSIDPASTPTGTLQHFTLTGSNFQPGASVVFSGPTGDDLPATAVTNSEFEIVLTAAFPADGVGPWSVSVTNPDGGTATRSDALMVTHSGAPTQAPVVTSASPSSGTRGRTVTLNIRGGEFSKDSSVILVQGLDEIPASRVTTIGTTQILARIPIPSDATPGPRDLAVVNDEGQAGMLPGGFTIEGDKNLAPSILMLSPSTMYPNATWEFTLSGNRFSEGATVTFSNTAYGSIPGMDTIVGAKKITGTLALPADASAGEWDVTVTNPDGGAGTKAGALTIAPWQNPVVSSVLPALAYTNAMTAFTLSGNYFEPGTTVVFQRAGSPDLPATGIVVVSGTKITGTLAVPANATAGKWDVAVTTPDGGTTVKTGVLSVVSKTGTNAIPTRTFPTRTFPTRVPIQTWSALPS